MRYLRFILVILMVPAILNIDAGQVINSRVDFYGHRIMIGHDISLSRINLTSLNQATITAELKRHRNKALETTVMNVVREAKRYQLDGTGITILAGKIASSISGDVNQQNFIKYLILKELGYDVLLTRTGTKLNCMGNLSYKPGRYIYITYNKKVYKDLDFTNRTNYTKHLIFMDQKRTYHTISRNVLRVPAINAKMEERDLNFSFDREEHSIHAVSNRSVTEFLGDLPLFDVGREFTRLSMSREMNMTLMSKLRSDVRDKDTIEAIRYLLSFVQQSVPYGSDFAKYGEERFYYPEETIMASTADCEDKALLFSHLLKRLLNINTIALYFEQDEHLSVAIALPDHMITGSFNYKGMNYVPCEPTAPTPRLGQSQFPLSRVSEVTPL